MISHDCSAYMDESGNDGMQFHKPNVSRLYILAAVVIDPANKESLKAALLPLREKRFRNAVEMKSDWLNKDYARADAMNDLDEIPLNWRVFALVTKKPDLMSKGFQHASSFVKFMLGRLMGVIIEKHQHPEVLCDNIKDEPFRTDCREYLIKSFSQALCKPLTPWEFDYCDSRDDVRIQMADLIAGTIRRAYESRPDDPKKYRALRPILHRVTSGFLEEFPNKYQPYIAEDIPSESYAYDREIEDKAVSEAYLFLEKSFDTKDNNTMMQLQIVRALLEHNYLQRQDTWVPTCVLRNRCNVVAERKLEDDRRLRGLIGGLRSQGLLIASRRHPGGYRLPTCMADVTEFLNTQSEKIKPMLDRVQIARTAIFQLRRKDILDDASFAYLKHCLPPLEG